MKRCSRCQQVKSLDEFGFNKSRRDGRQHRCLVCARIDYQEWEQRNVQSRMLKRALARDGRLNRDERRAITQVRQRIRFERFVTLNPERWKEVRRRSYTARRARKAVAAGRATTEQIRQRWAYYGGKCWMCGDPATETDHVIPIKQGGSDWPSNQRPACLPCNRAKGDKLVPHPTLPANGR